MKQLLQWLVAGGALALAACADGAAPVIPKPESVPISIIVPSFHDSAGVLLGAERLGSRRLITDAPVGGDDGSGGCGGCDGGGSVGGSGSTADLRFTGPYFTEAYFDGNRLVGHSEMSYFGADHAKQELTLTTWKADGGILGSQKFTTLRDTPLPAPYVQTLVTDGFIAAPACGGRGNGATMHEVSVSVKLLAYRLTNTSNSQMMYQSPCQTSQQHQDVDAGSGGTLRICVREDYYSASGEYLYTATLYCYDVNAA